MNPNDPQAEQPLQAPQTEQQPTAQVTQPPQTPEPVQPATAQEPTPPAPQQPAPVLEPTPSPTTEHPETAVQAEEKKATPAPQKRVRSSFPFVIVVAVILFVVVVCGAVYAYHKK